MKHSVNKIFKNLNSILLTISLLAIIGLLFIFEQYNSYKTIDVLNKQKNQLSMMLKEQREPSTIDILQYNYKIAQIHNEVKGLGLQQKYNYISIYLLKNTDEYLSDLAKLSSLIRRFDTISKNYFILKPDEIGLTETKKKSIMIYNSISSKINSISIKHISYDKKRFDIFSKIFFVMVSLILITTFFYRRKLIYIYNDLLHLQSPHGRKNHTDLFSQEAESIAFKMKRKTDTLNDPTMTDHITEINNNKGLLFAYEKKKSLKVNTFSCLTILEIDNFSKDNRTYSQEFTQEILRKVAYTISLYEQTNDIIARTDYNQFTLIFSRKHKDQLFKDMELIRESISEISLLNHENENESINPTVTGAFVIIPNNSPLEEITKKAKELLKTVKRLGTNRIYQNKDLPQ